MEFGDVYKCDQGKKTKSNIYMYFGVGWKFDQVP